MVGFLEADLFKTSSGDCGSGGSAASASDGSAATDGSAASSPSCHACASSSSLTWPFVY